MTDVDFLNNTGKEGGGVAILAGDYLIVHGGQFNRNAAKEKPPPGKGEARLSCHFSRLDFELVVSRGQSYKQAIELSLQFKPKSRFVEFRGVNGSGCSLLRTRLGSKFPV